MAKTTSICFVVTLYNKGKKDWTNGLVMMGTWADNFEQ